MNADNADRKIILIRFIRPIRGKIALIPNF